jgi:hypothetical protein
LIVVAALSDCPVEKSIIAKPIITMKTSLVVCIMSFSQVEVVEAFSFKMIKNNRISTYCKENLFRRPCRPGEDTGNSEQFFICSDGKHPNFSGNRRRKTEPTRRGSRG